MAKARAAALLGAIRSAERAHAKGRCKRTGEYLERAYRLLGGRRAPKRLERLERKFSKECLRPVPARKPRPAKLGDVLGDYVVGRAFGALWEGLFT